MNSIIILIILLIIYCIFVYIYQQNEYFTNNEYGPFNRLPILRTFDYFNPYLYGITNFPFWNTQLGIKSYMSHDLRGDPIIIPKYNFVWNNSDVWPIYNRTIFYQ